MFVAKLCIKSNCLLIAAAAVLACDKDDSGRSGSSPAITPVVKEISTRASGSALPGELISERITDSADGFEIAEIVYENSLPYDCSYSTKATPVTGENLEEFNMVVFADGEWYDNTIASGNQGSITDKYDAGLYFEAGCARDGDISLGLGWSAGTDGYYYYSDIVETGDFTGNLFDSFTKPTSAPVAGAHFEMAILVQAVGSDGETSCQAAFNL